MAIQEFVASIEGRLHPQPYSHRIPTASDAIHLILSVRQGILGRYALAVTSWDRTLDGRAFLAARRRTVRRALAAMWMFREVGLYLVVCGAEQSWRPQAVQMPADRTGLHAVILQAVHLVDLESGQSELNQAAWGPISFGGVDSLAPIIESAVAASRM